MNEIVPFGKYKGQPLEVLSSDKAYTDWLMGQDWFKQRYQGMYTIIINNFSQPTDTPDHNALQVQFLDDAFCLKVAYLASSRYKFPDKFPSFSQVEAGMNEWVTEQNNKMLERHTAQEAARLARVEKYGHSDEPVPFYPIKAATENVSGVYRKFEQGSIDVSLSIYLKYATDVFKANPWKHRYEFDEAATRDLTRFVIEHVANYDVHIELAIEIKPSVGDDYPSILRQMLANKSVILFVRDYTAVGATEEQFRKVMASSSKKVIFQSEVDECVLPAWVDELIDVSGDNK